MYKKLVGILVMTLLIATATTTIAVNINKGYSLKINDSIYVDSIINDGNSNVLKAPPFWWLIGSDQKLTSNCGYGDELFPPLMAAQEFKPTKDKLTAVALSFFKYNPPNGLEITVSIRGDLNGSDLTAITLDAGEADIKNSETWVLFDFTDIAVTPETTYYIVCSVNGGEANHSYLWLFDINNKYERGIAWFSGDSGATWFDLENIPNWPQMDFCFITYWQKPRERTINTPFQNFLQSYSNIFLILRQLFGL